MEEELFALLNANLSVPSQAIGWFTAPQGIGYPKVVLNVIDDADGLAHDGPIELFEALVQIDTYALDRAQAKAVSRQVRDLLHGYKGSGFEVIQHLRTRDGREGGSNEAERPYRVSMDFMTMWKP
jgi:hypothetical protein